MFKRLRNNKKSFYKELVVPEGCRELTDEEMFRINGGSTEKKEGSQESQGESQGGSVTVQSGNTMSQIVSDYNKANGTNYTVNEIAEKNGISNPDVIHPGQHINFGDSSSGAGNPATSPSASQANGNYGANGSYGSAGASPSNSSGSYKSTPSNASNNGISSATSTGSVASAGTITSPKYDSPTYMEKVAKYMEKANGNRTKDSVIVGKRTCGSQPKEHNSDGRKILSQTEANTKKFEIPNQTYNRTYAENLKRTGGYYYTNIKNADTPVNDMETRHAKAVNESIKHMYFDESRVKSTRVVVYRPSDGLGNSFDADRFIYKSDGVREFIIYRDRVGANCSEERSKEPNNFTEPDGVYHYTTKGLIKQEDGTYDSSSYKNTLKHTTNDLNIPKDIRDKINIYPADFLEHGNQRKTDDSGPYSTVHPCGGGCTIGAGGQTQQDEFMKNLLLGTTDLSTVEKRIYSFHHDSSYNP